MYVQDCAKDWNIYYIPYFLKHILYFLIPNNFLAVKISILKYWIEKHLYKII